MTGITDNIEKILPVLSEAGCLKGWTLVGGTALAIQIGHRESEDLDFMKWNYRGDCSVDWPSIKKELTDKFGSEPEMELLGHDQVQFFVNGVKLSFFIADCRNPLKDTGSVHGQHYPCRYRFNCYNENGTCSDTWKVP